MSKNRFCPNLSHPKAKALVKSKGLLGFYKDYISNGYNIVDEDISDTTKSVMDYISVNRDLFNARQQDSAVKSIIYLVQQEINAGVTNRNEIYNTVLGSIAETRDYFREEGSNPDHEEWYINEAIRLYRSLTDVVDNYEGLFEKATRRLFDLGISIVDRSDIQKDIDENVPESDIEASESLYHKTDYSDEANFARSSKDTASAHIKTELSLVPSLDYSVTPAEIKLNYLGLAEFEDAGKVWNELLFTLVDVPKGQKLKFLRDSSNPFHNQIYEQIMSNPNTNIQNEFEVTFSKQQSKFVTAIRSRKDNLGDSSTTVIDTNRSNPEDIIIEDWYNEFLVSDLVKKDSEGNLSVDIDLANKLKEQYEKIIEGLDYNKDKAIKDAVKLLNSIGISISERALNLDAEEAGALNPIYILRNRVKFIFDSLSSATDNNDAEAGSIEVNNPFINENSVLNELAALENIVNPSSFEPSFISGDNRAKYSFVNNSYLSLRMAKLKDIGYLEALKETKYASKSYYLDELINNKSFRDNFELRYLDTLGNGATNRTNKPFGKMTTKEKEFTRMSLFMNGGAGTHAGATDIGYFVSITPSDKTTIPVFKSLKVKADVNKDFLFSNNVVSIMTNQFKSEYNRVKHTIEQNKDSSIKKIDGYHGENGMGSRFVVFPFMNDILITKDSDGNNLLKELSVEVLESEVIPAIEKFMADLVKDQIAYWTENDLYKLDIVDKSYKSKNGITEANKEAALRNLASNYAINQFLFMVNQTQLISGDPALHGKRNLESTWVNFYKRMAKDIAPGLDGNFEDTHVNYIVLNDLNYKSAHLEEYRKILSSSEAAEAYSKVNPADAQEYTTMEEHIKVLRAYGNLTPKEEAALERVKNGGDNPADLGILFKPMKPVYVESVIEDGVNKVYYIKTSSFPLIPAFTKGLEIDKLRVAMENHKAPDGSKNPIGRAVYTSGMKLGIHNNTINVSNDGGSTFRDIVMLDYNIYSLPRSGFRIQQELPTSDSTLVNEGSQGRKLILNNTPDAHVFTYNGKKVTGREAKSIFQKLHVEKMNRGFDSALKELGIDPETGNIEDLDKIATVLRNEAETRNYPISDIYSVQVVKGNYGIKKFKVPLGFTNSSVRFESILNSIITNRAIKNKLPGFSAVQASSSGFRSSGLSVKSIEDVDVKNNITWVDPNDTELKFSTIKDGEITSADILVPNYIKGINLKDYLKPDGSLDTKRLPKDVLTIIGLRIPTQGYNSLMKFNVKGFLPDYMSDLVIVPAEVTVQMGSDFDVDKLFIYNYHYNVDRDGVVRKIKRELPDETEIDYSSLKDKEIDNLIIQMYEDRLSDPSIIDQLLEPNGFGKLPDVSEDVGKITKDNKTVHNFTSREQNHIHDGNVKGKMGTAIFSLFSIFNAASQHAGLSLSSPEIGLKIRNNKGEVVDLYNFSEIKNADGGLKSNVIMFLQSAAVDNANEQILGNLNINDDTMSVAGTMAMLGAPEDYIGYFMPQSVIKEYIHEINIGSDLVDVSTDYIHNYDRLVRDNMLVELAGEGSRDIENDIKKIISKVSLSTEDLKKYLETGNINKDIKPSNLSSLESGIYDTMVDVAGYKILYDFTRLRDMSNTISLIQSLANNDTKGLGPNMLSVETKINQWENLQTIIGSKKNIFKNVNNIFSDNTSAFAMDVIFKTSASFGSILPYSSAAYKHTVRVLAENDVEMSEHVLKEVYADLKSFLMSSAKIIGEENIDAERQRLIKDREKGLAVRWDNYSKTKEGKRNILTKRIKSKFSRNINIDHSLEALNSPASNEATDIENAIMHFYDMANSSNEEERLLAIDLVKYFILTGAQFGPRSIGKYITYDIMDRVGFSDHLREVFDQLNGNEAGYILNGFIDQYFQNNPTRAKNIGIKEAYSSVQAKVSDERIIDSNGGILKYLLGVVKSGDANERVLYKLVDVTNGEAIYKSIDILRNRNNKSYDFDKEQIPTPAVQKKEVVPVEKEELPPSAPMTTILKDKYNIGGDISQTLNDILEKSNDEYHRRVAADMLSKMDLIGDAKMAIDNTIPGNGSYSNTTGTVTINVAKAAISSNPHSKVEEVILHELLHALANRFLLADESLLTREQIIARNKINRLFNEYRKNHPNQEVLDRYLDIFDRFRADKNSVTEEEANFLAANKNEFYPLVNVREFVAAGLTNIEFRNKLKEGNLWQRLVDLISRALGLNTNDLEVLYESTMDLSTGVSENTSNEISEDISDTQFMEYDRLQFVAQRKEFLKNHRIKNYDNNFNKTYRSETQRKLIESADKSKYNRLKISFWNDQLRIGRVYPDADFDILDQFNKEIDAEIEEENRPKTKNEKFIDRQLSRLYENLERRVRKRDLLGNENADLKLNASIIELRSKIKDLERMYDATYIIDSMVEKLDSIEKLLEGEMDGDDLYESNSWLNEIILINKQVDLNPDDIVEGDYVDIVNNMIGRASNLKEKIREASIKFVQSSINERLDTNFPIEDWLNKGLTDVGQLESAHLDYSQSSSEHIQVIGTLIEDAKDIAMEEHRKFEDEFAKINAEFIAKYGNYDMLLEVDHEGNRTGNIINTYNSVYYTRSANNNKYWSENTLFYFRPHGKRDYEQDRIVASERLSEEDLKAWERENDPEIYYRNALKGEDNFNKYAPARKYLVIKPKPEFISDKYSELMELPEDDPARKFYDLMNDVFSRNNHKYKRNTNYIPEIRKTTLDYLLQGKIKGAGNNLWNYFAEEIDVEFYEKRSNVDEATGEIRVRIPVKMFGNKLSVEDKSYDLSEIISAVVYQEKIIEVKHITEPLLNMYYDIISDTMTVVGKEDDGTPILANKEARRLKEQSKFIIESFLYGKSRDDSENERKYGKIADRAVTYYRLLGMGWNPFSAIGNIIQGLTSNFIFASGGQYFNIDDGTKATATMLHSIAGRSGTAKKISKAFEYFDAFVKHNELNFGKSHKLKTPTNKATSFLEPFDMQQRGEYLVQGQTMLGILFNKKVKNKEGKEVSMWEAFDDDFNWNTEEYGPNPLDDRKARFKLRSNIRKAIIDVHGNYAREIMTKKHWYSRILYVFRTWLPQALNNRYGSLTEDVYLGTMTKGRYLSYSSFFKDPETNKIDFNAARENLLWLLRINDKTNLSEIDKQNMRKNLAELALIGAVTIAVLLMRSGLDDDQDEYYKYILNNMIRTQGDLTFFLSPSSFDAIIQDPIPLMRVVRDAIDVQEAAVETIMGEPLYEQGYRKGRIKLTKELGDFIPGWTQLDKNLGYANRIFTR